MKRYRYGKIKRKKIFKSAYARRQSKGVKVAKTAGFVALLLVLIFVGYSVSGPFMAFLSGLNSKQLGEVSSSELIVNSALDTDSSEMLETSTVAFDGEIVMVSPQRLMDPQSLAAFIDQCNADGTTACMVELKDQKGILYYQTALSKPKEYGALAQTAMDLSVVAQTFAQNGMTLLVRLHTFMDATAPHHSRDNTFKYAGGNSTWYDNDAARGGKPWLNPYKEQAVQYLLDIISEIADAGVSHIVLDSVQFPLSRKYTGVDFEGLDAQQTFEQALDAFSQKVSDLAAQRGITVYYAFPISAMAGVNQAAYGSDVLGRKFVNLMPKFDLSNMPQNAIIGDKQTADMNSVLSAVLQTLRQKSQVEIVPMIEQADTKQNLVYYFMQNNLQSYVDNTVV